MSVTYGGTYSNHGTSDVRVGKAAKFKSLLNRDRYKHKKHRLVDLNHATSQAHASSDTDSVQSTCCGVPSWLSYVKCWSLRFIYCS